MGPYIYVESFGLHLGEFISILSLGAFVFSTFEKLGTTALQHAGSTTFQAVYWAGIS